MVTREIGGISYYLLHSKDINNDNDVYITVLSEHIYTLRYYVKKLERRRDLFLIDVYEAFLFHDRLWLTKILVEHREVDRKVRTRYYPLPSTPKQFDEILKM
jgi:hypothetical protein